MGNIRLSRLRIIPCNHGSWRNAEFFLQGWFIIHSKYFEVCFEECKTEGRVLLWAGSLSQVNFFQPKVSGFLDCSHKTNLCFPCVLFNYCLQLFYHVVTVAGNLESTTSRHPTPKLVRGNENLFHRVLYRSFRHLIRSDCIYNRNTEIKNIG